MQEIVLYGVLLTLALYYYTQNYSLLAVNCYKVGSKLKLRLYATRIVTPNCCHYKYLVHCHTLHSSAMTCMQSFVPIRCFCTSVIRDTFVWGECTDTKHD